MNYDLNDLIAEKIRADVEEIIDELYKEIINELDFDYSDMKETIRHEMIDDMQLKAEEALEDVVCDLARELI